MKTLEICNEDYADDTGTLQWLKICSLPLPYSRWGARHGETNTIYRDSSSFLLICVSRTADQSLSYKGIHLEMYGDKGNEMNTNRAIQKDIMKNARLSFCSLTLSLFVFLPLSLHLFQAGWSRRHIINIQKMSVWGLCVCVCMCMHRCVCLRSWV